MSAMKLVDVRRKLDAIPDDANEAHQWRIVRSVTRQLLRDYGVPTPREWAIVKLPRRTGGNYGTCSPHIRVIRYHARLVSERQHEALAATIVHEAAHAINWHEFRTARHPSTWRGIAIALGLRDAQARNLPKMRELAS